MKPSEIFTAAAVLLEQPDAWTIGVPARDNDNHAVHPCDPDAVCWCTMGALNKVSGDFISTEVMDIMYQSLKREPKRRPGMSVVAFNDSQREAGPVVALLKRAAIIAKDMGR